MKKNYYYAIGDSYGGIYNTYGLHNNKKELKKFIKKLLNVQKGTIRNTIVKVKIEIIGEI